jgi:hypothetical protein
VQVGGDWTDGFLVGKAAAISDWRLRKEINDPEFERLIDCLRQKRYWANLSPEERARHCAYRKKWREDNPERYRAAVREAKRRGRKRGAAWYENEKARRRAKRAAAAEKRRHETVYTCIEPTCGAQWCIGIGRLPQCPPKFCSGKCRAKHNHQKGRAAGKPWAKRDKTAARAGTCACGAATSRKGARCAACVQKRTEG